MESGKNRKSITNCVFNCTPIASSHLYELLYRPCFKPYSNAINYNLALRKTNVYRPFYGIWSLFPRVHAASPTEPNKKIFSLEQSQETGMDRLKTMFRVTEFGHLSPELGIVANTLGISLFMGAIIGGTIASRTAVEKLVRQYQAAVFNHQFEAKRMFQDRITLTLAGTAFKWAWRLALFSGTYVTIVVSATVYNNKSTISDHIAAGAFCGSMWKLKMGLRATAVGGGLGGILGLFAGCLSACVLWISGTSVEEMRYWHHDYWEREYRRQAKMIKEKNPNQISELLAMEHDERLQQEQKTPIVKNNSS